MVWASSSPRYFTQPEFDMELADEIERRLVGFEEQRQRAREDPELSRRLIEHSQKWGQHARPGVLEGMARAGIEADDPVAESIAEEAGAQQVMEGKPEIGQRVNGSELRGDLTDAAKTFTRGMFTGLEAPFREAASAVTALGKTFLDDEQDLSDFVDNYTDHGGSRLRKAYNEWRDQGVDWRGLPILGDTVAKALPEGDQGIHWTGEEEFLGEGWLPSQESGISQQVEEEKHRLSDDGEFLTPGRLIPHGLNKAANRTIIEPDSTTYHAVSGLADFTANIALDPATYVTGGYAKISQAAKKFGTTVDDLGPVARRMAESSLVPTPRADLIGENVDEFLRRPEGGAVVESIRDITSPNTIRRGFQGKIDNDVAVDLARADSDDAVRETLGGVLGPAIREKPRASQFTGRHTGRRALAVGALHGERGLPTFDRVRNQTWQTSNLPGVRRNLQGIRLFHWAPERHMDLNDPRRSAQILDDHLRNAKVPDEDVNRFVDEFMELDAGDYEGAHGVVRRANEEAIHSELVSRLRERGGLTRPADAEQRARELARVQSSAMDEYAREARSYLVDRNGKAILPPDGSEKMVVNGEEFDLSGGVGYMLSHARDDAVFLPDHREIRRTASAFGPMWDTPYFGKMSRSAHDFLADTLMSKVWKPATLLRPAIIPRVVGEEQARMAADGDASMMRHPAQYMAYVMGQRGQKGLVDDDITNVPEHLSSMSPSFQFDHLGEPIHRSQLSGDWLTKPARGKDGAPLEDAVDDWASYIGKFAVDPVARRVAGMDLNDAKRAFWDGELADQRRRLMQSMNMRKLRKKSESDKYVQGLMHALTDGTGGDFRRGIPGNAELMSGIAEGRIRDVPVAREAVEGMAERPMFRSREVTSRLEELADSSMPNFLPRARRASAGQQDQDGLYDRAVEFLYKGLMSKPTDRLSRDPYFKQQYWADVERQLPFMTRKLQRETLQRGKAANLSRKQLKRMQAKTNRPNDPRLDSMEVADTYSKAQALGDTKDLLYDLSRRSQFADMLRAVAPFAEPWKEIIQRWSQLSRDNPAVLRRAQQAIDGARRSDPNELISGGDPSEGGFFYQDGDREMFMYPASDLLTRAIGLHRATDGETDVGLTGQVTGLNLMGNSILPGLGPGVTIPASALIPEDAKQSGMLNELLFPFGEPETGSIGEAIDSIAPAWMQRLNQARRSDPHKDRVFGNTVIDTARALKATGNYSHPDSGMMDRKQMNRLEADAFKYARRLYWFRSFAQTTLPTGPEPEFNIETPEQEMTFRALMEDYRKELDENPRDAFNNFTERFGVDVGLTTQGKTKSVRPRAITEKGLEWERQNEDLLQDFPNVAGYFTPEDPEGEFDYNAYLEQLETGDRIDLKPDEVLLLQNNQLGKMAIENAERKLGEQADTSQGRAFLSRLRDQLKERYPGYLSTTGIPQGVDLDRQIAELRKASNDERLSGHPIAQGTREWLRIRDTAESFAKELPGNVKHFGQAQAARPIRDWMRAEAQRVIDQYPEWAPVYDRVFSRELNSDDFEGEPDPDTQFPQLGSVYGNVLRREQEADLTQEPDWSMEPAS